MSRGVDDHLDGNRERCHLPADGRRRPTQPWPSRRGMATRRALAHECKAPRGLPSGKGFGAPRIRIRRPGLPWSRHSRTARARRSPLAPADVRSNTAPGTCRPASGKHMLTWPWRTRSRGCPALRPKTIGMGATLGWGVVCLSVAPCTRTPRRWMEGGVPPSVRGRPWHRLPRGCDAAASPS
jgi:hypothetical protein